MDNPANKIEYEMEGDSFDETYEIEMHQTIPDMGVDIVLHYDAYKEQETDEMIFDDVESNTKVWFHGHPGDYFHVKRAGTEDIVYDFKVKPEEEGVKYTIIHKDSVVSEL